MRRSLTSPKNILAAGGDFLVYPVMREGGYVRCDGRKSTQILRDCEMLVAEYDGKLLRLHVTARDTRALEQRLLACGVGPITMNIFFARAAPLLDQSVVGLPATIERA